MEVWKKVESYPGGYEVSNYGRVRNANGKILVLHKRSAYLFIGLHYNGSVKSFDVHRLVAEAFVPGRDEEHNEVNHKNLNKLDNRAINLEWVSRKENVQHAFSNGAILNHVSKDTRRTILCVELGKTFTSSYEAAAFINAEYSSGKREIATIARNIRWHIRGHKNSAYGFHWKEIVNEPSTTIPEGSTPKRVEMGGSA